MVLRAVLILSCTASFAWLSLVQTMPRCVSLVDNSTSWLFMSRPGFTDSRFFVKTITLDLEVLYSNLSLVDSSQASSVIVWRSVKVSASRAISSGHVGAPTYMEPIVFPTPDCLFRNGFPLRLNRMVELSPPCQIPWPS